MNKSNRMIALCRGSRECINLRSISGDDDFLTILEGGNLSQTDIKKLLKDRHDIDSILLKAGTLRSIDPVTFKNLCKDMRLSHTAFETEIERRL